MNHRRTLFQALLVLVAASAVGLGRPAASPSAEDGRVVVLGFDGADARTARELLEARPDDFPNLRRLRDEGTFAPLTVVAPPESPVSWAALNTGQNPAKTGVPGFVKRSLAGRSPGPALGHLENEEPPLEELEHAPLPTWSPGTWAAVGGGAVFLVVLVLLSLLLRGRILLALVVALVCGVAGAWGGARVRSWMPESVPRTTNPNQARNLWDYAGDAGVPSVVLDPAQAFDMPAPEGVRVLAGLGVPDARGSIGDWFLYTTAPEEFSRPPKGRRDSLTGGTVFRVDEYDGEIATHVYGPRNFWREDRLQRRIDEIEEELSRPELGFDESVALHQEKSGLEEELRTVESERTNLELAVSIEDDRARVRMGDREQILEEGQWSEFYELGFRLNPLIEVRAITRARVNSLRDPFELFVNVLDIDPRSPPFWQPISEPFGFSAELADQCGLYETYGWSTATMPFKDGIVPPELLLEDVEFTMAWRERLTYSQLAKDDWRLLMSVFSTTDRIQHMFYRCYDAEHPAHDPQEAGHEVEFFGERMPLSETIPMIYRQMDRVIGRVLDELGPNDTLLVCSDHGFQSFRRQVHVNNLLAELGYLTVEPLGKKSDGDQLRFVNWSETQAYSLGMGFVYLNLKGRERQGIVEPDEADELLRRIKADILQARDPDTGDLICKEVYITKEVHEGPYLDLEADLLLGFAPTYRVSWASTFGGLSVEEDEGGYRPAPLCSDNESLWSGDHISVALPDVAGVFLSNRRMARPEGGAHSLQIAPTALDLLGVRVPAEMDAKPVAFVD